MHRQSLVMDQMSLVWKRLPRSTWKQMNSCLTPQASERLNTGQGHLGCSPHMSSYSHVWFLMKMTMEFNHLWCKFEALKIISLFPELRLVMSERNLDIILWTMATWASKMLEFPEPIYFRGLLKSIKKEHFRWTATQEWFTKLWSKRAFLSSMDLSMSC